MSLRAPVAVVESVFDNEIKTINALEQQIILAEDDADAKLWEQAEKVVAQLEAGLSQVKLAEQWINARTGESYSRRHVQIVAEVWRCYLDSTPRPRFRDAYNDITHPEKNVHVANATGDTEWYSPEPYIAAAKAVMGGIDLDPASCETANAIVGAAAYYTQEINGLTQPWRGRVWMNPPYAKGLIEPFCERLRDHVKTGAVSQAVVLVNNATETEWFGALGQVATAVCFPKGRVRFWHPDDKGSTPLQGQAVVYCGPHVEEFYKAFCEFGTVAEVIREEVA